MRLWRVPERDDTQGTEFVLHAETKEDALALLRGRQAAMVASHPSNRDDALYDEIEEITDPVYSVPFYGYSW